MESQNSRKLNMYSSFTLAKKYARYYFTAANGKGHGVHSPFVFNFIKFILRDTRLYYCYGPIEQLRSDLLKNNSVIEVEDFGAGSTVIKSNRRIVSAIAKSSLKPKKFAQLLFRMVNYYQPQNVLELGTSLGITSAYLASGNSSAPIYTCEGAKNIAAIAQQNFNLLGLTNTIVLQGDFAKTLPVLTESLKRVDFAFIDGNHRKDPTLQYFEQLLNKVHSKSILVFDDIHWSAEMEAAWESIKQHPAITLSIDLFFIGIVFFDPAFTVKQHFTIRF
jgi:predicted O-methyltransferase YrrM